MFRLQQRAFLSFRCDFGIVGSILFEQLDVKIRVCSVWLVFIFCLSHACVLLRAILRWQTL